MILEDKKIVFIGNPKVASDSMNTMFRSMGYESRYGLNHMQWHVENLDNPKEYQYFMIIRNPWDRMVSWYFHHRNTNHPFIKITDSFENWVRKADTYHDYDTSIGIDPTCHKWWKNHDPLIQLNFIKNSLDIPVHVIYYENLKVEMEKWVFENLDKVIDFPWTNPTKVRPKYRDVYPEDVRKIVDEYLKDDIGIFDYDFDTGYSKTKPREILLST